MIKVISCGIFEPYIKHLHPDKTKYDFTYLEIHQHEYPQRLGRRIQEEINQTKGYEKIIILYGLCGGALLLLEAIDIPIIVVKVHDCMSILLGSKEKYKKLTQQNMSLNWSCYSLKKNNIVNNNVLQWEMMYDEDTVEYLKEVFTHQDEIYISLNIPEEKECIQDKNIIEGSLEFLSEILNLRSRDILYVYPNQKIKQVLDDEVIDIKNS